MTERYKCHVCERTFNGVPGPTVCSCGSVYSIWLTYSDARFGYLKEAQVINFIKGLGN